MRTGWNDYQDWMYDQLHPTEEMKQARAFGVPFEDIAGLDFGLTYEAPTAGGWELDPATGNYKLGGKQIYRKKASPEDIAKYYALSQSMDNPFDDVDARQEVLDRTGLEYDPVSGYLYSSMGHWGSGGGPLQYFGPVAGLLGLGAAAGYFGGAGAAAGSGTGSTTAGTGAAASGMGLDPAVAAAAGGDPALIGGSGAGAFGSSGAGASGTMAGDIVTGQTAGQTTGMGLDPAVSGAAGGDPSLIGGSGAGAFGDPGIGLTGGEILTGGAAGSSILSNLLKGGASIVGALGGALGGGSGGGTGGGGTGGGSGSGGGSGTYKTVTTPKQNVVEWEKYIPKLPWEKQENEIAPVPLMGSGTGALLNRALGGSGRIPTDDPRSLAEQLAEALGRRR